MNNGDRAADLDWRRQADEGGCADWGLAFARIPAAPPRHRATRREKLLAAIALTLVAAGLAAVLISEGRVVWPL